MRNPAGTRDERGELGTIEARDFMTVEARQTRYVHAYGRAIAIEADDTAFEYPFLPFDWQREPLQSEIDRKYAVERVDATSWTVEIDDGPAVTLSSEDAISEYIEGDLHHWLATYTRGFLFVHAGCVSWRDHAIVIPGRSYAGKTTLTRALLLAGATYYSDDYAVIDPTGAIFPFARRLRVRPEAPGPSARVDPAENNWPIGQTPIRAKIVAELKFDADAGWNVETLSRGMGALSLLDNTVAARERPEDALRIMSLAMAGSIAIRGTRDDATSTANRLIAMIDASIEGNA